MSAAHRERSGLYGVLGEFADAPSLVRAAARVRGAGYTAFDAFAPYPVAGIDEAMGNKGSMLPLLVLLGALAGGVAGYGLQYFAAVVDYPWNVGGKPLHSWPAFVPITFELTVLGGAVAGVIAMVALNGLPEPHHPLFDVPSFDHASQDAFFLCIEARDAKFDRDAARELLLSLGAKEVIDVAN